MSENNGTELQVTTVEIQDVDSPGDFFNGFLVETPITLNPGQGFKGYLQGEGEIILWETDGEPRPLRTWLLRAPETDVVVRLLGSVVLDRELERVQAAYVTPCLIAIHRGGQKEISGGKRVTMYTVAVHHSAEKKSAKNGEIPF